MTWTASVCDVDAMEKWGADTVLRVLPTYPNSAIVDLAHDPHPNGIRADAHTPRRQALLREQIHWDGDRQVTLTGPLHGASSVSVTYAYYPWAE